MRIRPQPGAPQGRTRVSLAAGVFLSLVLLLGLWNHPVAGQPTAYPPGSTSAELPAPPSSQPVGGTPLADEERSVALVPRPSGPGTSPLLPRAPGSPPGWRPIDPGLRRVLSAELSARLTRDQSQETRLLDQATQLLEEVIAEAPSGSEERADAILRLAELHWERSESRSQEALARWENAAPGDRGESPLPDFTLSRSLLTRLLAEYPGYRDTALALYLDGFLASESGKPEEARERFTQIVAQFEGGRFAAEAHLVLGEQELSRESPNYAQALANYQAAARQITGEFKLFAKVKSAWCLWRLGRPAAALAEWSGSAGSRHTTRPPNSPVSRVEQEAWDSLVTLFAEDPKNSPQALQRFLIQAQAESLALGLLESLALRLWERAEYERALEVYQLLLQTYPAHPEAPGWALAKARAHATIENYPAVEQDFAFALTRYAPKPPQGNPSGPAVRRIERELREEALRLHAAAQRDTQSRREFEGAAALYRLYLRRFEAAPAAVDLWFNWAEIDFRHLDQPRAAASHYWTAARANPKGPLARDALYFGLIASRKARGEGSSNPPNPVSAPDPLAKEASTALSTWVAQFPDDPRVPLFLFQEGRAYHARGEFNLAVQPLALLLEHYPAHPTAAEAGQLLLDSFNRSQDFEQVEEWARRLKTHGGFSAPEEQLALDTLLIQVGFKRAEHLVQTGSASRAARLYLSLAQDHPTAPQALQAAVNACSAAASQGHFEILTQASRLLIERYPRSPESALGLWSAAQAFQQMGLLDDAARVHTAIATGWPGSAHHREAAYNAVLLQAALGRREEALASAELFVRQYSGGPDSHQITFLRGQALEKAKQLAAAADLYDKYAHSSNDPNAQVEALTRLAELRLNRGDLEGASNALLRANRAASQGRGSLTSQGKYYAAQARYLEGQALVREFKAVELRGNTSELLSRLRKKSQLLEKAAKSFLGTAEIGVAEWTTRALFEVGQTYEAFSQSLLTAAPPNGLSPAAQDQYREQIAEAVVPIEERSIEAYESGWLKARELGIFNEYTAKMRAALGRLAPEQYPPLAETEASLQSGSPVKLPPLILRPRRSAQNLPLPFILPAASPPPPLPPAPPAAPGAKP